MSDLKKISRSLRTLLPLGGGFAVLLAVNEGPIAQVSEIDSYDRAVTSQSKEAALAFLKEFRSSHLVGDLIESLRPDVARAVCAELPSGVSRARRVCERLPEAPVVERAASSRDDAGGAPQSSAAAAPTQRIETQPIAGIAPAPATTGAIAAAPATAPQTVAPAAGGQSPIAAAPATAGSVAPGATSASAAKATPATGITVPPAPAGASGATAPASVATRSTRPTSALPEPAAATPPTSIKSIPVVYVRSDSGANILAQAVDGSAILGTAPSNTPLTVLYRYRDWLKVLVPGTADQAGWVHASRLESDAGVIKIAPAREATTPPAAAAPGPGYRIQLLATKIPSEAENAWQELQMAYPDLLRDLQFSVTQVDLGAAKGGVWYRGLAGPLRTRDEAEMLCVVIKSSPPYSDCFVAAH